MKRADSKQPVTKTPILIFVRRDDGELGQYSRTTVEWLLAAGQLKPDDLAWASGFTNWMPLSHLIGSPNRTRFAGQEHVARPGVIYDYMELREKIDGLLARLPMSLRFLFWFFAIIVIIGLLNMIGGHEPFGQRPNSLAQENAREIRDGVKAFDPTMHLTPAHARQVRATAEAAARHP